MNRKIICFDLDNTLLDHRTMKVPDSSLRALDALRKKGSIIVLATGRDMDNYYSKQYLEIIREAPGDHGTFLEFVCDDTEEQLYRDAETLSRWLED